MHDGGSKLFTGKKLTHENQDLSTGRGKTAERSPQACFLKNNRPLTRSSVSAKRIVHSGTRAVFVSSMKSGSMPYGQFRSEQS